jgi:hypothetical protein
MPRVSSDNKTTPMAVLNNLARELCLVGGFDCLGRETEPGTCGTCADLAITAMRILGHDIPAEEEIFG